VELAKRQAQYATAACLEITGQKLIENQEAAARVADMVTEIYTMESAVVRAAKMSAAGHRWAELARDCAEIHVNEGCGKVQNLARLLLAEVLEAGALDQAMADLRAFDLYVPVAGAKLRDRVAAQLIEKGAYPIEHY
jgi:alkylation response protein AidB-like acyl-CoA dehydrogenase